MKYNYLHYKNAIKYDTTVSKSEAVVHGWHSHGGTACDTAEVVHAASKLSLSHGVTTMVRGKMATRAIVAEKYYLSMAGLAFLLSCVHFLHTTQLGQTTSTTSNNICTWEVCVPIVSS